MNLIAMFSENHIENAMTVSILLIQVVLIKDLNRKYSWTLPSSFRRYLELFLNFRCAMDATSATKMHFQSDMVCTVKLTTSTESPRGTRFSRYNLFNVRLSYSIFSRSYYLTHMIWLLQQNHEFRGLEPRGELTYPAWKNTYQENENCDSTGCNYGNGQFGPYFGDDMFVEPPRIDFNIDFLGNIFLDILLNNIYSGYEIVRWPPNHTR